MQNAHRILIGLLLGALAVAAACRPSEGGGSSGRADAAPSLLDLDGRPVEPPEQAGGVRATVFVFVMTDCPISNRYAPEINRLHERFSARDVAFHLVYPNPDQTAEGIRAHMEEFGYRCAALRDPHHLLVARTGANVAPEAAVYVKGEMIYRGRIDDRFIDFGKTRAEPTRRDLQEVLERVVAGETLDFRSTEAVGCYLRDLAS